MNRRRRPNDAGWSVLPNWETSGMCDEVRVVAHRRNDMLFRSENAWSVKEHVIAKTWIRMITIKPVTYVAHPGTASDVKRRIKRHSASTARARTENAPV